MVFEVEEEPQQVAKKKERARRSYWSNDEQVFFTGGYSWGLRLVEVATKDGRRCFKVEHICLGREEEVLAVLDGKPMSDTLTPIQRSVMTKIVESMGRNGRSSKYDGRIER